MGKLSSDMITKQGPGQNKRRADETIPHYLNRLTHIYLQEKSIEGIETIPICKNLSVIYLYDNHISKIENLEFAPNLTHLYLQNNKIKRLENLSHLTQLTKLHIGGNSIKVLEGLENLRELVELHIENQKLPLGEKLLFDPRTLMTLMSKMQILNISGNNLDTLSELGPCSNLRELSASNNNLNDIKETTMLLKCWYKLNKLKFNGNPMCTKNKYRERIIVNAPNIEVLDGKEIQDLERQFLQNWKVSKETTNQRSKQDGGNDLMPNDMLSLNGHLNPQSIEPTDFPRMNPIIPTYIMPGFKKKQLSSGSFKSKPKSQDTTINAFLAGNMSNSMNALATNFNNPNTNAFQNSRFLTGTNRVKSIVGDNEIKYPSSKSASVGKTKFIMNDSKFASYY